MWARRVLGEDALIGRSTHDLSQALEADREGFDYIGVGPVFETPTKPGRPTVGLELVREASENLVVPFVAIGGIDAENLPGVLKAGASQVAVVRAVMARQDPREAARHLIELLKGSR
jgi:thiamine-phosphate pyrophosphorylase